MARTARAAQLKKFTRRLTAEGRWALKFSSALAQKSWRVATPPPVDNRQRLSDSQAGMALTLSNATTQPFEAAMSRSRSSRGKDRSDAVLGSTSERRMAAKDDFADPCSPTNARTG